MHGFWAHAPSPIATRWQELAACQHTLPLLTAVSTARLLDAQRLIGAKTATAPAGAVRTANAAAAAGACLLALTR